MPSDGPVAIAVARHRPHHKRDAVVSVRPGGFHNCPVVVYVAGNSLLETEVHDPAGTLAGALDPAAEPIVLAKRIVTERFRAHCDERARVDCSPLHVQVGEKEEPDRLALAWVPGELGRGDAELLGVGVENLQDGRIDTECRSAVGTVVESLLQPATVERRSKTKRNRVIIEQRT